MHTRKGRPKIFNLRVAEYNPNLITTNDVTTRWDEDDNDDDDDDYNNNKYSGNLFSSLIKHHAMRVRGIGDGSTRQAVYWKF
jgi:hypothetical protein